jgi:hypothetical protein
MEELSIAPAWSLLRLAPKRLGLSGRQAYERGSLPAAKGGMKTSCGMSIVADLAIVDFVAAMRRTVASVSEARGQSGLPRALEDSQIALIVNKADRRGGNTCPPGRLRGTRCYRSGKAGACAHHAAIARSAVHLSFGTGRPMHRPFAKGAIAAPTEYRARCNSTGAAT